MRFRAGFVQNSPKFLRVRENVEGALKMMARGRADLWVLPEFFATGYNFKSKSEAARVAEDASGGYTIQTLQAHSEKQGCSIVAGFVERSGSRLFNSAVLIDGAKIHLYRKTHLFGNEKKFFSPGDTGFKVWTVRGVSVGIMICFDWFFPEAARSLALAGAQIIAHPSNLVLPWGPQAMKIRSLENRVFTVTANRVGLERGLRFIGQSQIVSSAGKILAQAPKDRPATAVEALDPSLAKDKKVTRLNDLFRDRRPRMYR